MYMHVKYHAPDTPVEQEVEGRGEEKGGGIEEEERKMRLRWRWWKGKGAPLPACAISATTWYICYNTMSWEIALLVHDAGSVSIIHPFNTRQGALISVAYSCFLTTT